MALSRIWPRVYAKKRSWPPVLAQGRKALELSVNSQIAHKQRDAMEEQKGPFFRTWWTKQRTIT